MTDPNRVDFSSLDPSTDQLRWERSLRGVLDRTHAARFRLALEARALRWAPAALAAGSAAVVLVWMLGAPSSGVESVTAEPASAALVRWAEQGQLPPPQQVLQVLGGVRR
jgi:hypothetical protein